MQDSPPVHGNFDGVPFSARPERFAGNEWWRVYVDSNPRVLVRYREYTVQIAEVLAADEAQFRRASRAGLEPAADKAGEDRRGASPDASAGASSGASASAEASPEPEPRRSWRRPR